MTYLTLKDKASPMGGQSVMDFSHFDQAMRWAELISKSDICPKECRGKPGDVLIRIEFGKRLGLSPMQALCNIATINGKPSMYGDGLIAICRSSALCESIKEVFDEKTMTATCLVKRKGEELQSRSFSMQDAKLARLWGKPGPWSEYPKRMLQMRARAWALRDLFPDLLGGISFLEEAQDIPLIQDTEILPSPAISLEDRKREGTEKSLLKRLQAVSTAEIVIDKEEGDVPVDQEVIQAKTLYTLSQFIGEKGVSSERIDKWLKKAQASTLEDLSQQQGLAIIAMLERESS